MAHWPPTWYATGWPTGPPPRYATGSNSICRRELEFVTSCVDIVIHQSFNHELIHYGRVTWFTDIWAIESELLWFEGKKLNTLPVNSRTSGSRQSYLRFRVLRLKDSCGSSNISKLLLHCNHLILFNLYCQKLQFTLCVVKKLVVFVKDSLGFQELGMKNNLFGHDI